MNEDPSDSCIHQTFNSPATAVGNKRTWLLRKLLPVTVIATEGFKKQNRLCHKGQLAGEETMQEQNANAAAR